jgi:hypothetical protein
MLTWAGARRYGVTTDEGYLHGWLAQYHPVDLGRSAPLRGGLGVTVGGRGVGWGTATAAGDMVAFPWSTIELALSGDA